jgi:hypothetical protein
VIPLLCLACGWRGRRTPKVSCPRCTSPEVLESAVDGWAYDDLEDARENPGSAGWGYVDKSHFRCMKCHHEWTAVTGPLRPMTVDEGRVVAKFQDDDSGYRNWSRAYPSGYVLNCERHPSPNYLIVHRADCASISELQPGAARFTGDYIKVCSTDRQALRRWARDETGGSVSLCGHCM